MKQIIVTIAVAMLCFCATSCKSKVDKALDLYEDMGEALMEGNLDKIGELDQQLDSLKLTDAEQDELEAKLFEKFKTNVAKDYEEIREAAKNLTDESKKAIKDQYNEVVRDLVETGEDINKDLKEALEDIKKDLK